ncbi:hypothetical protein VFPPC_15328 [Pochonia chlamydosporia 170]|uniref:Uncharacterized protein n=1 Tax=Pochonia chlamydosporia 170 TaxID=1380566 RepID=A0A179G712_METCM|nr:hypothetical protein VFPPC_15328 [Pochonia chlamydosporia 170]OAQ73584.1 hypothetical protein VFPPC_15328 [Pochonia chlamydosporia 170]
MSTYPISPPLPSAIAWDNITNPRHWGGSNHPHSTITVLLPTRLDPLAVWDCSTALSEWLLRRSGSQLADEWLQELMSCVWHVGSLRGGRWDSHRIGLKMTS